MGAVRVSRLNDALFGDFLVLRDTHRLVQIALVRWVDVDSLRHASPVHVGDVGTLGWLVCEPAVDVVACRVRYMVQTAFLVWLSSPFLVAKLFVTLDRLLATRI